MMKPKKEQRRFIYEEARKAFGVENQMAKAVEEAVEFVDAFNQYKKNPDSENFYEMIKEMADVKITQEQLLYNLEKEANWTYKEMNIFFEDALDKKMRKFTSEVTKENQNKRKVYISGPITGKAHYREDFLRAEEELVNNGYTRRQIINPANMAIPGGFTHEEIMKIDIAALSCCSTIYMLRGWRNSKGALEEYNYAVDNEYTILYQTSVEEADDLD